MTEAPTDRQPARPRAVLFTGGGTGGHLYPGLALATRLRERNPDARILFIGTARLEATKVPEAGFQLRIISVKGLAGPRTFAGLLRKAKSAALLAAGIPLWQSLAVLRSFRPDVVVGTGGYVCGPVMLAARLLKIPAISVEQNMRPGLTTRALSRLVDIACLISEDSIPNYPMPKGLFARPGRPRLVVTGSPVRAEFLRATRQEGLAAFGLTADRRTLLVCGGSLGSRAINAAFMEALESLADEHWFRTGVQIIHVTGSNDTPELGERAKLARVRYVAYPYLDNLPQASAAADLIISRGGGSTLAEIAARGLPAIIIPWSGASNNEQYHNAKPLARAGGAIVMQDDELTPGRLATDLRALLQDPSRLQQMAAALRTIAKPDAADRVLELVEVVGREITWRPSQY